MTIDADSNLNEENKNDSPIEKSTSDFLKIKISNKLFRTLSEKAKQEGLNPEELAHELIAEGLVLRAWEILERKSAMKGSSNYGTNNNNTSSHKSSRTNNKHRGPNGAKNRTSFSPNHNKRHHKYTQASNILDNNANFIEYVRNQESKKY